MPDELPDMPDPAPEDLSDDVASEGPTPPVRPERSTRMPPATPPAEADADDLDLQRALASDLLSIGAVSLSPDDPFTWSSGMLSPIYCDNRRTLGYPRIRTDVCDGFERLVRGKDMDPDVVAGTATAGIPHAAWLADRLDLPMAYVRSSAKSHGTGNQIEGVIEEGDVVVLVEDLVSTGGSALTAVEALRDAGAVVRAVVAIFTYELATSAEAFAASNVALHTLTSFSTLVDVAQRQGDLSGDQLASLRDWRSDPQAWDEKRG
jgi:orotate phosphoribosyltransferase